MRRLPRDPGLARQGGTRLTPAAGENGFQAGHVAVRGWPMVVGVAGGSKSSAPRGPNAFQRIVTGLDRRPKGPVLPASMYASADEL